MLIIYPVEYEVTVSCIINIAVDDLLLQTFIIINNSFACE